MLGVLLVNDENGNEHDDQADLQAAIAALRAAPQQDGKLPQQVQELLAWAQLRAGQSEDALRTARAASRTAHRDALLLAAVAVHAGTAAALREAALLGGDADERAKAKDKAGRVLISLRRYPESAALIEAGGLTTQREAAFLRRLRRARRHEEYREPAVDPVAVARAHMMEELRVEGQKRRRSMGLYIDSALAGIDFSVRGDAAQGYQVSITGQEGPQGVVFLSAEGGRLRVIGTNERLSPLGAEALRRLERGDVAGARRWLDWAWDARPAPGGQDPLAANATYRLYEPGKTTDPARLRIAAADLMAQDPALLPSALPILEGCQTDQAVGALCALAVAWARIRLGQPGPALELFTVLGRRAPDSAVAVTKRAVALQLLNRTAEARRLLEERLAAHPGEPEMLRLLGRVLEADGKYAEAERVMRQVTERPERIADDSNNLAWVRLLQGTADDRTEAEARRGAADDDPNALHTLAAVHADRGQVLAAVAVLKQRLEKTGQLASTDYYVLGRIAEECGLGKEAAALYAKVKLSDGEPLAASTLGLAQRRLSRLQ